MLRRPAPSLPTTAVLALGVLAVLPAALLAGCSSDDRSTPAPGDADPAAVVVGTEPPGATTTTLQDLDDLVSATDRPPMISQPPGDGAAADALGQVAAVAASVQRSAASPMSAGALAQALADALAQAFGGCETPARAEASTTGSGAEVTATLVIGFGCDPTTDRVTYRVTMAAGGGAAGPWTVTAATRTPHCTNGVLDGLCT